MAFRLQKRKLGLTYPQCPCKERVFAMLKDLVPSATCIIVGWEAHEDGGMHLHCLVESSAKIETENVRHFDLVVSETERYHPNFLAGEAGPKWRAYCMKEDLEPLVYARLNDCNPEGYLRRKQDFEAWMGDMARKAATCMETLTFTLPQEWVDTETEERGATHRFTGRDRGGMVLVGPSGIGKSTMIRGALDPVTRVLTRGLLTGIPYHEIRKEGNPLYHYEKYQDQPFILYDDAVPVVAHLLHMLDHHPAQTPVPGEPRFHSVSMRAGLLRNVIVLGNDRLLHQVDWTQPGLNTRFRVYQWCA